MISHPYRDPHPVTAKIRRPLTTRWKRFKHFFQRCDWVPILLDLQPRRNWCSIVTPQDELGFRESNPLTRFQAFSSGVYNDGTGVVCTVCDRLLEFKQWDLDSFFKLSKVTRGMLWTLHQRLRLPCKLCGRLNYECLHFDNVLRGIRVHDDVLQHIINSV